MEEGVEILEKLSKSTPYIQLAKQQLEVYEATGISLNLFLKDVW